MLVKAPRPGTRFHVIGPPISGSWQIPRSIKLLANAFVSSTASRHSAGYLRHRNNNNLQTVLFATLYQQVSLLQICLIALLFQLTLTQAAATTTLSATPTYSSHFGLALDSLLTNFRKLSSGIVANPRHEFFQSAKTKKPAARWRHSLWLEPTLPLSSFSSFAFLSTCHSPQDLPVLLKHCSAIASFSSFTGTTDVAEASARPIAYCLTPLRQPRLSGCYRRTKSPVAVRSGSEGTRALLQRPQSRDRASAIGTAYTLRRSAACHLSASVTERPVGSRGGIYLRSPQPHTSNRGHQLYAMFTGIVEDRGRVVLARRNTPMVCWDGTSTSKGLRLRIGSSVAVQDCYKGCSISVDGVCLTVVNFRTAADNSRVGEDDAGSEEVQPNEFDVDVSPETLRRTTLGDLEKGDLVNVERAAKFGDPSSRNSGHYVQGHVDGKGRILAKWRDGDAVAFKIQYSPSSNGGFGDEPDGLGEHTPDSANEAKLNKPGRDTMAIVEKGFVAVDGISLTVTAVNYQQGWFSIMLVPYTQLHVTLPRKRVGDYVNIELDVMAKYALCGKPEPCMESPDLLAHVKSLEQRLEALERKVDEVVLTR